VRAASAAESPAVISGIAWLVYRARQGRSGRPSGTSPVYQLRTGARHHLKASDPAAISPASADPWAIEPNREIHLHLSVTLDKLAANLRHSREEE
jgi:hypothetical protein